MKIEKELGPGGSKRTPPEGETQRHGTRLRQLNTLFLKASAGDRKHHANSASRETPWGPKLKKHNLTTFSLHDYMPAFCGYPHRATNGR